MRFPDATSAGALPLHVLVRDFPETLAVLRRAGVDVPALGGRPLEVAGESPGAGRSTGARQLIAAMSAAAAWRDTAPPGPCDRAAESARAHAAAAAREQAGPTPRD